MVEELQHEKNKDEKELKLLVDLIITIDRENNKSVNVQLPQFKEYKIGKFS